MLAIFIIVRNFLSDSKKLRTIFSTMMTIELKDLRFYAYHGLFEEEKIIGNHFFVQVSVSYLPKQFPIQHLSQTIDYGRIFEMVDQRMRQPTPLLEALVTLIADDIRQQFPAVAALQVQVEKCQPPVLGWSGSAVVRYSWQATENL